MVIKNVSLETVCGITSTFPENPHFEVAFAGKSNVGKSSLINALMNRKSLARTSAQPGKTQTINFYNINDAMYLVDLPGYGYANASVEIKAKWGKMIERYLHTSQKLKAVFLLIDIRHEPSENDCLMYDWMVEQGFAPIIIATKMDKISRGAVQKHVAMIKKTLNVEPDTIIIPFSAETKQGREEIWTLIDSLVLPKVEEVECGTSNADGEYSCYDFKNDETLEKSGNLELSIVDSLIANDEKTVSFNNQKEQNVVILANSERHQISEDNNSEKKRKPRWKATGKAPAKKTVKQQAKKAEKKVKMKKK